MQLPNFWLLKHQKVWRFDHGDLWWSVCLGSLYYRIPQALKGLDVLQSDLFLFGWRCTEVTVTNMLCIKSLWYRLAVRPMILPCQFINFESWFYQSSFKPLYVYMYVTVCARPWPSKSLSNVSCKCRNSKQTNKQFWKIFFGENSPYFGQKWKWRKFPSF